MKTNFVGNTSTGLDDGAGIGARPSGSCSTDAAVTEPLPLEPAVLVDPENRSPETLSFRERVKYFENKY